MELFKLIVKGLGALLSVVQSVIAVLVYFFGVEMTLRQALLPSITIAIFSLLFFLIAIILILGSKVEKN